MLILFPVALVGLTSWLVRAFGGTISIWLLLLIMLAGGSLGHFVFSRIAAAHLRQFYSDYIQTELRSAGV
jgi:hypothetical protein